MALGPDDLEGLRRQARGHVESLRRAGVEWLPLADCRLEIADGRLADSVNLQSQIANLQSPQQAPVPQPRAEEAPPPAIVIERGSTDPTLEQRGQALQVLAKEVSTCS